MEFLSFWGSMTLNNGCTHYERVCGFDTHAWDLPVWNLHILWETGGFSHCPKTFIWGKSGIMDWLVWVRVSRVLPHFKPRLLGNGWTQHNPASSLWRLDILQYLYLVLQGLSVVLARIFLLLFFFKIFRWPQFLSMCRYTTLHSTYLLGHSVLGIKRSHTRIKSDLLTLVHCAVSCELVLADMVTAESNLWVSVGAAKVADCWWSDGSRGPWCFPGQTLPFWAAGGDLPSHCCEEMTNAGWTLCVRV